MISEQSARTWREFIDARLLQQHQDPNSGMSAYDYQKRLDEAESEHQGFLDAWHRGDQAGAENEWWGLKNIANEWRVHPEFPEPISDGTLPCPVPAPETGHPCVKPVHPGWTPSEGHGGGHFWQAPRMAELERAGAHIDYRALLSGQPAAYHLTKDCTPECWQWRN